MRIFRKKKYEVKVVSSHERYLDEKLDKAQDEGWEIAGSINVHRDLNNHHNYVSVPMKREMK